MHHLDCLEYKIHRLQLSSTVKIVYSHLLKKAVYKVIHGAIGSRQ